MTDTGRRAAAFLDKHTPAFATPLRDARRRLRAHVPRGVESVFDNTGGLVFGIGPAGRTGAALIAQAALPYRDALAAAPPRASVIKREVDPQRRRRPASQS